MVKKKKKTTHLTMQETQETRVQSLGREDPLEEGMANPLQYSCLENLVDRQAWWLQSSGSQSQTRLKQLNTSTLFFFSIKKWNFDRVFEA